MAKPVPMDVLKELELVGFKFYMDTAVFVTPSSDVEQNVLDALANVPAKTRDAVVRLVSTTSDASHMKVHFEFKDGMGELTSLIIRTKEIDGRKAVAVLAYGTSFDTAKVVEEYETKEEQIPIYEDEAEQVLDRTVSRKNGDEHSYNTVTRKKFVKTVPHITKIIYRSSRNIF